VPVVIDEFPYLAKANPRLPSIIQNALAPLRAERETSRARLLLCGSAMSFMGRLLGGGAPLRGRAGLELVVPTLDYRRAAEFWGIDDPATALKVNAVVGGTPAYRREFARDDSPASPGDFDSWVARTVLSPASPLFREARYLLADEPDLRDAGLYHSVLAAIAAGNSNRGGIASYLGRKSGDLAHPLTVLEDCGMVTREPDVFKDNRTSFRIAEPLVTFYHAVMRPIWSDLEHTRDASRLWQRSRRRFAGNVLGPHFEHLCRHWARHLAPVGVFGDYPSRVGVGTVNDPAHRTSYELDVVVFGLDEDDRARLVSIGEAKWGETMGSGHLDRLRRIRALLVAQGRHGAETATLACYSGAGFSAGLEAHAAEDGNIVLVGLDDLYGPIRVE
jgi:AAA+ ATPase superfamily predicted ATPase